MYCELVHTVKLLNTSIFSQLLLLWFGEIYSQHVSILQCSINSSHLAVHEILRNFSSYKVCTLWPTYLYFSNPPPLGGNTIPMLTTIAFRRQVEDVSPVPCSGNISFYQRTSYREQVEERMIGFLLGKRLL